MGDTYSTNDTERIRKNSKIATKTILCVALETQNHKKHKTNLEKLKFSRCNIIQEQTKDTSGQNKAFLIAYVKISGNLFLLFQQLQLICLITDCSISRWYLSCTNTYFISRIYNIITQTLCAREL